MDFSEGGWLYSPLYPQYQGYQENVQEKGNNTIYAKGPEAEKNCFKKQNILRIERRQEWHSQRQEVGYEVEKKDLLDHGEKSVCLFWIQY